MLTKLTEAKDKQIDEKKLEEVGARVEAGRE